MFQKTFALLAVFTVLAAATGNAQAQQRNIPTPLKLRQGAQVNSIDLAQAAGSNVNLEIVSACVNGAATFKIRNKGDRWPQLGKLKVYQISGGQPHEVATREMRFAHDQKASFRMKNIGTDKIGLFVEPSWYDRPFQFDAEVSCR